MLLPDKLQKKDKVALIAPSSFFSIDEYKKGLEILKSFDLEIYVPKETFLKDSYLPKNIKKRAELLNDLFKDKSIKAIISIRGGFGSVKMLPYLDFNIIKNNPKIFTGFSDVTILLLNFYQKANLITYHSPLLVNLHNLNKESQKSFFESLFLQKQIKIPLNKLKILKKGFFSGEIIGGNLTSICSVIKTKYEIKPDNKIIFMEDINEPLYKIDRMITQLKLMGFFDNIKGLILGSFSKCGNYEDICRLIFNLLSNMNFPIVANLETGHTNNNLTILIGSNVYLDDKFLSLNN